MATILDYGPVPDGFDVRVRLNSGEVTIFHFLVRPANRQAAVDAIEQQLIVAGRSPVEVTAEDNTLIRWPVDAPQPPLSRTIRLTTAQATALNVDIDDIQTDLQRIADVWGMMPPEQIRLLLRHSPVLLRFLRMVQVVATRIDEVANGN